MCKVPSCDSPVLARNMCSLHYKRWYVHGNTEPTREYHHMYRTPEYTAWRNMIDRCNIVTQKSYKNYGGRGIKVCDRWRNSFLSFYADMGNKPSAGHSIDRIDVNGNYEPSNCRWAKATEQQNNRRNNRVLEYKGKSQTMSQWAIELGININTLKTRLNLYKWPTEKALSLQKDGRRKYAH